MHSVRTPRPLSKSRWTAAVVSPSASGGAAQKGGSHAYWSSLRDISPMPGRSPMMTAMQSHPDRCKEPIRCFPMGLLKNQGVFPTFL